MTITPDQARELLDGATQGPWRALHDQWEDEDGTPCEDFYVLGGPDGILHTEDFDPDTHNPVANTALAAAAPALAQTIAGMRWEYAVEHLGHVSPWGSRESAEDDLRYYLRTSMFIPHLVHRLVGPAEPIAKETQND